MSRGALRTVLCLLAAVCILVSCAGKKDYATEPIVKTVDPDSEIVGELCGMLRMLTVNSPILPEVQSIDDAMESCRDSILYYMLVENYGKYTGDIEKLDLAVAEYPQMQITNLIPAREFEETVYAAFGGTRKISNKSGRLFVYLERVAAYTSVTMVDEDSILIDVSDMVETENTYRMIFRCIAGDVVSEDYRAVFIKRDDGSAYFHSVVKFE